MMNSHEVKFHRWFFGKAQPWLTAKRGRYAALARHLEVSRQTVSRWFVRKQSVPGWAAVAMNIYLVQQWKAEESIKVQPAIAENQMEFQQVAQRLVTPQADSRFGLLEFVPRSGDKLVSPQADEREKVLVRR